MKRLSFFLITLLLALPLAAQSADDDQTERILSFDSHIVVRDDGSMLVKETIQILYGSLTPAKKNAGDSGFQK